MLVDQTPGTRPPREADTPQGADPRGSRHPPRSRHPPPPGAVSQIPQPPSPTTHPPPPPGSRLFYERPVMHPTGMHSCSCKGQCISEKSKNLLLCKRISSLSPTSLQNVALLRPDIYRPPTKLREGNVFTSVCLFRGVGLGFSGPIEGMFLPLG